MDSFLHNHQASLDRQREEAEISWLFPDEEAEIDHYETLSELLNDYDE